MNAELAGAWAGYWPEADAAAMARDAEARVAAAVRRWALREVAPVAGGNVSVVLGARRGDGEAVILKVNPRGHGEDAELAAQAGALRAWAPTGVVPAVLDVADGGQTVLMERAAPGTTLDAALPWDARLDVIAGLVARLHASGAPVGAVTTLVAYSGFWRRALEAAGAAELALLDDLLATAPAPVVLHADLHGGNVLRHGDRWVVIDPHAVAGDPAAEVWALIDPLAPVATPAQARRYAAAAGLDAERALGWARVRARAEACAGADGDAAWAARLHATADALR